MATRIDQIIIDGPKAENQFANCLSSMPHRWSVANPIGRSSTASAFGIIGFIIWLGFIRLRTLLFCLAYMARNVLSTRSAYTLFGSALKKIYNRQ